MKSEIQILIGNIGSGKSTECKRQINNGYLIISKDDLRYSLGAGKYTFNPQFEYAIHITALTLCDALMALGKNIIIDETNMDKETRKYYIKLAKKYRYKRIAVIFPKLTRKESVKRRLISNHGDTSKEIWEEVWDRKNEAYERPTRKEGFHEIIELER
ncbi:MAG: ATP-binding protein [Candidatus Thorarchaeota archaeon]|jgi:predicted kinase